MEEMLDVVGEIYEAAWHPEYWDIALKSICQLTGSKAGSLVYEDHLHKTRCMIGNHAIPKAAQIAYSFGLAKHDPAFKIQAQQPVGKAQQIMDAEDFRKSNPLYYHVMAKPSNIGMMAAINLFNDESWHCGVGIHRKLGDKPYSEEDLAKLELLTPHLQRSLRMYREWTRLQNENHSLSSTLSRLMLGVMITNSQGKLLYQNPVAERLLHEHGGLSAGNGELCGYEPEEQQKLKNTLKQLSSSDPKDIQTRNIILGFSHPDHSLPLTAIFASLGNMPEHLQSLEQPGNVAIYLSNPDSGTHLAPENVQTLFGLTEAEARVAIALSNGLSVKEIAEQQGVSKETIRSQLKSIFHKLGANKQQDIVRILIGSAASIPACP